MFLDAETSFGIQINMSAIPAARLMRHAIPRARRGAKGCRQ
jgi:hypothetical protein